MAISDTILNLLYKQLQGTLTAEEAASLQDWLKASPRHQALADDLNNDAVLLERLHTKRNWQAVQQRMLVRINAGIQEPPVVRMRSWRWAVAAAVVALATVITLYYQFLRPGTAPVTPPVAVTPPNITPGTNGAVLTLADGRQVVLDSMRNGVVAEQQGAQATLKDGRLVYDGSKNVSGDIVYNTMSTPKGRQFELTLPDGTKVWLNAASSIRYPTTFTGANRTVDVTGEVYLEVAADKSKPFYARINDSTRVAVLGTSFNVNAYANESSINTTLLDGKVNVVSTAGTAPLRPGQQAQLQGGNTKVVSADVEQVMAWKNGLFNFEGATLAEIMRQIERWYDVEVVYARGIPSRVLHGKMTRDVPLQGLLMGLNEFGVRTELKGRTLTILP